MKNISIFVISFLLTMFCDFSLVYAEEFNLRDPQRTQFLFEFIENNGASNIKISEAFKNDKIDEELLSFTFVEDKIGKPVITVGYSEGLGLVSNASSYNAKGYGYDLLKKFGRYAGIEFKFVEVEGTLIEAVEEGIVDIAGFYSLTPERASKVAFGRVPVDSVQFALTTKGESNIFYSDAESINGKTVATYEGNLGNIFLDKFLEENNISVNYVYGDIDNYEELDADFYLMISIKDTDEEFHSVLNLELRYLFFITNKNNEKFMNYFDKKLYEFFVNNFTLYKSLAKKYNEMGNEFQNRALTKNEAMRLKGKTFKVGYAENHAPYQEKDLMGKPRGIAVEFMNMLAEKYDFNVEYIPYNLDKSWAGFEDLDIIISLTGERNHILRFYEGTEPYHEVAINIIHKENYTESYLDEPTLHGLPKDAKIGILNYINFKYGDFFSDYPFANLRHYTTTAEIISALNEDNIDAIIATEVGTNSIASLVASGRYQNTLNLPLQMNFQISRKISEDYLEIFNTIINKQPKQVINEIVAREVAKYVPKFATEQFIRLNFHFIFASIVLLIFIVFGFSKFMRQRSVISMLAKDDITPLSSVLKFTDDVDSLLHKADVDTYEMILLDIDYFRMVINYYGSDKGTEVIKAMAEALLDAYKKTNTLITRRVGDQFLVFKKVNEGKPIQEVVNVFIIPRIKGILGESYSLKLSIGSAKNHEKNAKMSSMLENAITAHQKSKYVHKTSFEEFNEECFQDANSTLETLIQMKQAVLNKEFKVYFQPKIALESSKVVGAEALVRWIPLDRAIVYPSSFIPIMEKNGFIGELDLYIFEEVCSFISGNLEFLEDQVIAINLSPITLTNSFMLTQLAHLLEIYQLDASRIEIEISESVVGDFENILPTTIHILHQIGFSVAMDAYGANNSSINKLCGIGVDVMKLDQVFFEMQEKSDDLQERRNMIQQIISLGQQLGMKIVAEGVETVEEAKILEKMHCDIVQGFYYSEVLDAESYKKFKYIS